MRRLPAHLRAMDLQSQWPTSILAACSAFPMRSGNGHCAFQVDVTEERSVERLFADVESELGPALRCWLASPVGRFSLPDGGQASSTRRPKTEVRIEALNSRGPLLCIRAMLRRRREKPVTDGRIVTVSSMSGITPESPTGPAYSVAEAAIIHLTRVAALEAAPMPITVTLSRPD